MLEAVLLIAGIVAVTVGALLLTHPHTVVRLSELGNRVVATDHFALAHRRPFGGFLLIVGAFFLFYGVVVLLS